MGLRSLLRQNLSIEMSSYHLHYTAAALAASVVEVTISDSVAQHADLDIDTALVVVVADDDRIAAAEMAADSVDYYLYRDTAADKTLEVLEVDRSTHLQRLEPMRHNFVHTAFDAAAAAADAAFVVADWSHTDTEACLDVVEEVNRGHWVADLPVEEVDDTDGNLGRHCYSWYSTEVEAVDNCCCIDMVVDTFAAAVVDSVALEVDVVEGTVIHPFLLKNPPFQSPPHLTNTQDCLATRIPSPHQYHPYHHL